MNPVERAQELFAAGNHRAALNLLKPLAQADNPPYEYRRALAELYRAMGCPDQAGRWGIAIEGWTTPLERDRLARLLASTGGGNGWVRQFLVLPRSGAEPAELATILKIDVPRYRTQMRARDHARAKLALKPKLKRVERVEAFAGYFGAGAALIGVVSPFILFVFTIIGLESTRSTAIGVLVLVLFLFAACLVTFGCARLLERKWALASVRFLWGLLTAAVGVGVIFFVAGQPL